MRLLALTCIVLVAASGCRASSDSKSAHTTDEVPLEGAPQTPGSAEVGASYGSGSVPPAATTTTGEPDAAVPEPPPPPPPPPVPRTYVAVPRTIVSRGVARSFLLATPEPRPAGNLPLVFGLHGDGGTPDAHRASFAIEEASKGEAIFVYPAANKNATFEYWTDEGRDAEAAFVTDVIASLAGELPIDQGRVFLSGFSGGATMANGIACLLGSSIVRGVGIHSGTLYSVSNGALGCSLPGAVIIWGNADGATGTSFAEGERTRDRYQASLGCASTTAPAATSPCVQYDGCRAPLTWCPIDGLGHAPWSSAASVMWASFASMR